jgi:hypothetical protein
MANKIFMLTPVTLLLFSPNREWSIKHDRENIFLFPYLYPLCTFIPISPFPLLPSIPSVC